jgi:2-keto-4-pentenoate hydratase/2-oxohepta-3-ene-1,7-dioic acid hydratase in catechol pathway
VRLATVIEDARPTLAVVNGGRCLPVPSSDTGFGSIRELAAADPSAIAGLREWAHLQHDADWRSLAEVELGAAIPDPGAIYTIGHNYRDPADPHAAGPERPLVYGKAASSVGAHGRALTWDRTLAPTVDAEVELGVVIGAAAWRVPVERAFEHVFGYTIIDDVSSRDAWLDGDQWLLGKSMPGFCPVGPWIVTPDEFDPSDAALRCTINGEPIQDGRTTQMRFGVAEIVSFLSRHVELRPGDLIASGTPARLRTPPGPDRHLQPGDVVTCWIDGIGELTSRIT